MTADPYLPQETIDHIVDFLYDKPETLNACCLVSKSWIPRARKYLFAKVEFSSIKDFESWMETFPDTFNSPGHHTRTLIVRCARVVAARDGGTDDLIRIFPSVVRLTLTTFYNSALLVTDVLNTVNLTPLYELSSTLKSLHVDFIYLSRSQTFNFLSSLPLLEDLGLVGRDFWPEASGKTRSLSSGSIYDAPYQGRLWTHNLVTECL